MSADTVENTTFDGTMEVNTSTERFLTFSSNGLNIGVSTNYVIEIFVCEWEILLLIIQVQLVLLY